MNLMAKERVKPLLFWRGTFSSHYEDFSTKKNTPTAIGAFTKKKRV